MALLHYLWSWDLERTGPFSMVIQSDFEGPLTITLSDGVLVHAPYERRASPPHYEPWNLASFGLVPLARALSEALAAVVTEDTVLVRYEPDTGYALNWSGSEFSITFPGEAGERMRRALGFAGNVTAGDMVQIPWEEGSPFTDVHMSSVRPIYQIIPAMEGRSKSSDEYEPDGIVDEAVADSGQAYQIAKDTSEIWLDWTQESETNVSHEDAFGSGTPMHRRFTSAAVPWSYQDAWDHGKGGQPAFLVADQIDQENEEIAVYEMRAEGLSFKPTRFAAQDTPLFSVVFRTRLLGRP